MSNITQNDFSAGWCPSDDNINGRPNALLQMDNVDLDTNGALSLIGGTAVKQTWAANAHTLFSRIMGGSRKDYGALADGKIMRGATQIATGGDGTNAGFGTAFDYTLIASGTKLLKDNGTTAINLGVLPPTAALAATGGSIPYKVIGSLTATTVTPVGSSTTPGGSYLELTADANGLGVVQTYNDASNPRNANLLTNTDASLFGLNTGFGLDSDIVQFTGYVVNPIGKTLKLDVLLVAGNASGDPVTDFYTYKIDLGAVPYDPLGVFTVNIRRDQFERMGGGSQDWSTIYGYRISFITTPGDIINIFGAQQGTLEDLNIRGGSNEQNGIYQYVQVNVNNTGTYFAQSPAGPIRDSVTLPHMQALVVPQNPGGVDTQVNEVWIFRRGGLLDKFYRVAVRTTYGTFIDAVGDLDALKLNITLNTDLIGVLSIPDKIYAIVGPVQQRWFYFTSKFVYPSDYNNPDSVDPTRSIRITGSNSENFLWAMQVAEALIMVGTSVDVYTLHGTFSTFPDGSLDIYYHGLGCKFPPITYDADVFSGAVIYLANDGWRSIDASGQNPLLVAPNTDRLYRGITCYNYTAPNLTIAPGSTRFPVCIAQNKLWCFITGTNRCEVFDLLRKYWRTFNYGLGDVTAAVGTQDGQILAFYGTDKKLREINKSSTKLIDGASSQTIRLMWTVRDDGTPRQRKDSATFKARLYTNNVALPVVITNDLDVVSFVGNLQSDGLGLDKFLDLSIVGNVAVVKTYQVTISGAVSDFLLEDWDISYTLRPPQVSFLRTLPNNYGTTALKRLFSVPFQIDTLGVNATVTPYLDNVPQTALIVNSAYKRSFTYEFPLAQISDVLKARDYEYVIHSDTGLFEFFGFSEPRNVEVFPEPRRSHVVPVTNFGNASKKRLRVWPFVVDPKGNVLTFTPIVDQVALTGLAQTFNHTGKKVVFVFYTSDVFGVDYSGYWTCSGEWEFWETMAPTIVQVLPIAKRFDQIGPEELFKYGKIKEFDLRVMPFGGTSIPYTIYFSDTDKLDGSLTVVDGKEDSYSILVPKGTSGRIARITFGPTAFDFHRFYVRLKAAASGSDTELNWITVANE